MSLSKMMKGRTQTLLVKTVRPRSVCPEFADIGRVKDDVYVVEKVLDKKMMRNADDEEEMHYEVKWMGWAKEYNTWEPMDNLLNCKVLLRAFERAWKKKHKEEEVEEEIKPMDLDVVPDFQSPTSPLPGPSGVAKRPRPASSSPGGGGGLQQSDSTLTMAKFFQGGIEWIWPIEHTPIAMVGCFVKDRLLCYIIKVATDPPIDGITEDNVVIVRGKGFRKLYPDLVIPYYESSIVTVPRIMTEEEIQAKVAKEMARVQELEDQSVAEENFDVDEEDIDEDGLPVPDEQRKGINYKKPCPSFDSLGLPIVEYEKYDDSESEVEDTFEELDFDAIDDEVMDSGSGDEDSDDDNYKNVMHDENEDQA